MIKKRRAVVLNRQSFKSFMCSLLLVAALLGSSVPSAMADTVVLLHGIAKSDKDMRKMAKSLQKAGYRTINIHYPSRQKTIQQLVNDLHQILQANPTPEDEKIHFVAHSMGGLLTRLYLHQHRPMNIGRVVMLGTPNKGSEVADVLKNNWIYQAYYGPAGQELVTKRLSFHNVVQDIITYDLGIIAGDRSLDPISSMIIPGKDDGKVAVENTKILGMLDHVTMHATHTFIMKNKGVIQQVHHFLEHGRFINGTLMAAQSKDKQISTSK